MGGMWSLLPLNLLNLQHCLGRIAYQELTQPQPAVRFRFTTEPGSAAAEFHSFIRSRMRAVIERGDIDNAIRAILHDEMGWPPVEIACPFWLMELKELNRFQRYPVIVAISRNDFQHWGGEIVQITPVIKRHAITRAGHCWTGFFCLRE